MVLGDREARSAAPKDGGVPVSIVSAICAEVEREGPPAFPVGRKYFQGRDVARPLPPGLSPEVVDSAHLIPNGSGFQTNESWVYLLGEVFLPQIRAQVPWDGETE